MTGHRRQYGACALHAGYSSLQTQTFGVCYINSSSTETMIAYMHHIVT